MQQHHYHLQARQGWMQSEAGGRLPSLGLASLTFSLAHAALPLPSTITLQSPGLHHFSPELRQLFPTCLDSLPPVPFRLAAMRLNFPSVCSLHSLHSSMPVAPGEQEHCLSHSSVSRAGIAPGKQYVFSNSWSNREQSVISKPLHKLAPLIITVSFPTSPANASAILNCSVFPNTSLCSHISHLR